jgi:hypothetical protein
LDGRDEEIWKKRRLRNAPPNPQLLENSTIVDYGMEAIGQLLGKVFYLLLSELLKKNPREVI